MSVGWLKKHVGLMRFQGHVHQLSPHLLKEKNWSCLLIFCSALLNKGVPLLSLVQIGPYIYLRDQLEMRKWDPSTSIKPSCEENEEGFCSFKTKQRMYIKN